MNIGITITKKAEVYTIMKMVVSTMENGRKMQLTEREYLEVHQKEFMMENGEILIEGTGLHQFSDGRVYSGQWRNDQVFGRGTLTYPDGTSYEGDWKINQKHGRGVYKYPSGALYEG